MQFTLNAVKQQTLLSIARNSIELGISEGQLGVLETKYFEDPDLQQIAASFVTLKKPDSANNLVLRGCIGSLSAVQALAADVHQHAFAAAYHDTRFEPVARHEISQLHISISVLSPHEELLFNSKEQLLQQLRPGKDGLIIECHGRRATFLPSVWESLPEKQLFLTRLLEKARLGANFWSREIKASRYCALNFGEP